MVAGWVNTGNVEFLVAHRADPLDIALLALGLTFAVPASLALALSALQLVVGRGAAALHLASVGVASWYDLARALFRALELAVEVRPIPTTEYPTPAARPPFSALTTLQQPRILLPAWQDGVKDLGAEGKVRVLDVAELLAARLPRGTTEPPEKKEASGSEETET